MIAQDILAEALCEAHIAISSKKELLKYSAECVTRHPSASHISQEVILKELVARERASSTGFGNEVAIPHARIKGMSVFILFALTHTEGIGFNAIDKAPVKLFLVLIGPEERVQEHIKILALLSRTLSKEGVKEKLIAETKSDALAHSLKEELAAHDAIITSQEKAPATTRKKMTLLIINLYEDQYLQQILESLLEYNIDGATIIDSSGMGQFLSEAPLFGNFMGCMLQNRYHSKTIMAVADTATVETLFDEIEQGIKAKNMHEIISLFAIKIEALRGSMSVV